MFLVLFLFLWFLLLYFWTTPSFLSDSVLSVTACSFFCLVFCSLCFTIVFPKQSISCFLLVKVQTHICLSNFRWTHRRFFFFSACSWRAAEWEQLLRRLFLCVILQSFRKRERFCQPDLHACCFVFLRDAGFESFTWNLLIKQHQGCISKSTPTLLQLVIVQFSFLLYLSFNQY